MKIICFIFVTAVDVDFGKSIRHKNCNLTLIKISLKPPDYDDEDHKFSIPSTLTSSFFQLDIQYKH